MKQLTYSMVVVLFLALVGCSGSGVKPSVELGDQFKVGSVLLTISQHIEPNITYHTEAELQELLRKKIKVQLAKQGLLSQQSVANYLTVQVAYQRKFLNEQSPHPSGALAYPQYSYEIKVMNGATELGRVSKKNREFKGRFIMNIDVIEGRLKKKSDEIVFIDGLAKEIVRSVYDLKKG